MGYKIDPITGKMSEYIFDFGGILALRNFTAKTIGERLIIHSAQNANFTILEALVSEVEIDGVIYDNAQAAQEALQRLVFNPVIPVIMTLAQQQLLEGAMQRGEYSGTASDLIKLLEKKIKEIDLSGKLDKGTYNGTGQDLKQAIDNINTVLQSDDSTLDDLQEIVNYIKVNKNDLKNLSIDNIAGLVDALASKSATNHTHNEYALVSHTHSWNDIENKPIDLATTQNITDAIKNIQIGGRNLILNSHIEQPFYIDCELSEPLIEGETYTFSWESIGKLVGKVFINNSVIEWYDVKNDGSVWTKYAVTFVFTKNDYEGRLIFPHVYGATTVRKYKLERGNKPTDWSPAPEDTLNQAKNHANNVVNNLQIGGRNLLLQSNKVITSNIHLINTYDVTETINIGDVITLSVDGDFAEDCFPSLYNNNADSHYGYIDVPNKKSVTVVWDNNMKQNIIKGNRMNLFIIGNSNSTKTNTIRKIKLEKGNKPTDYTPAPEDFYNEIETNVLKINASVSTSQKIRGYSQQGRTVVTTGGDNIIITVDSSDGFCATYQKAGTGNIVFVAGDNKTIVQVDSTNTVNGAKGSTATITVVDNDIILRISNI